MSESTGVPKFTNGISGKPKGKDSKKLILFKKETPKQKEDDDFACLTFVEVWVLMIKKALINTKNLIRFFLFNFLRIILELIALKEKHYPPKKNKKDPIRRSISNSNFNRLVNLQTRNGFIREKPYRLVIEMEGLLYGTTTIKPQKDSYLELKPTSSKRLKKDETYYIVKRPYLDYFLKEVKEYFHIIIFTVVEKESAQKIIDFIDPNKCTSLQLFQDSCLKHPKGFIKELSVLGDDFSDTILIDHSEQAISLNQDNAILVDKWNKNQDDFELDSFARMLVEMAEDETSVEEFVLSFKE